MARKRIGKNHVTLARALSKFGVASRKQSAALILARRVIVNSRIASSPDMWIDPKEDRISVDGKVLRQQKFSYLKMNKPVGIITTRSDELGRKTVFDVLPEESRKLFPVGRLDKDTSGLLLFTNDTRWGDALTNPLKEIPKTYNVEIDKPLRPEDRHRLELPFVLKDGTKLKPATVVVDNNEDCAFTITIVEGKNRQIRRVCEELGYEVRTLSRLSVGSIRLGTLKEGEVRPLSEAERESIASLLPPRSGRHGNRHQ